MTTDQNSLETAPECTLLNLPVELLCQHILQRLDAGTLARLGSTCSFFQKGSSKSVTALAACHKLSTAYGTAEAKRFKDASWNQRLLLEESLVGFRQDLWQQAGFTFLDKPAGSNQTISLQGLLGPKLLVSDKSTHDQSVLRWRFRVSGNRAVEFGVVPAQSVKLPTALHKHGGPLPTLPFRRQRVTAGPVGFCSMTTGGSLLPFKAVVQENCVVEIVARRSFVEYLVCNPPTDEMTPASSEVEVFTDVQPGHSVPKEVRISHEISPACAYHLASTCWANGRLEIIPSFTSAEANTPAKPAVCEQPFDSNNLQPSNADASVVMAGGSMFQIGVT